MASLDESDTPAGDGRDADRPADEGRESLERRVRELERENARLRGELEEAKRHAAAEQVELSAYRVAGLPGSREELDRMRAAAVAGDAALGELIGRLEQRG